MSLQSGNVRFNFSNHFVLFILETRLSRIKPFESTTVAVRELTEFLKSNVLSPIISNLSCVDLNNVLFRCKEEEGGVYSIPNYGEMVYTGLQGIASILDNIAINNDLGHPVCQNLRSGDWLMGMTYLRFK